MTAVDIALDSKFRNKSKESKESKDLTSVDRIFVLGRPPGHHAGPNGCVVSDSYWSRPDMASSGFCLLNTVAVAASYARYQSHSIALQQQSLNRQQDIIKIPKIAIIDIDIHHGKSISIY